MTLHTSSFPGAWGRLGAALRDAAAPDRRSRPRQPLRRAALLELPGRAAAVMLFDLSDTGAGASAPIGGARVGEEGHLVLDTAMLPVRVAFISGGRIGLAFQGVPPAALATLQRVLIEEGLSETT
jgi:hypothetical protein